MSPCAGIVPGPATGLTPARQPSRARWRILDRPRDHGHCRRHPHPCLAGGHAAGRRRPSGGDRVRPPPRRRTATTASAPSRCTTRCATASATTRTASTSPHGMRASTVLEVGTAGASPRRRCSPRPGRAVGIPSRLGLCRRAQPPVHRAHAPEHEDRHLRLARLHRLLARRRVAQRPRRRSTSRCASASACTRSEFDGVADSIYHPFDRAGNRHMEYVRQRGTRRDAAGADPRRHPEHLPGRGAARATQRGDFLADVERETR